MPVTPAPAIARMAELLTAMGQRPDALWTLADLCRATGISKASAHSVLLALADARFVRRHENPAAYSLGPALTELGDLVRPAIDLATLAEHELTQLSRATGFSAMVGIIRGQHIVVLRAVSVPHPFGMGLQQGHQTRLAAPTGTIYVAWGSTAQIDRWLDGAGPDLPSRQRRQLTHDLALVRDRGWSATIRIPTRDGHAMHEARTEDLERGSLELLGLGAPVWDPAGRFECSVAVVSPGGRPLAGHETQTLATTVVDAAQRLTTAIAAPGA